MTCLALFVAQTVLVFAVSDASPKRFGFPVASKHLLKGLHLQSNDGAKMQWRPLQQRPDPVTDRLWVEIAVTGVLRKARIKVGGAGAVSESDGPLLRCLQRSWQEEGVAKKRWRWLWHSGEEDWQERHSYEQRYTHANGEVFAPGESYTTASTNFQSRFVGVQIHPRWWRQAGILPGSGKLAGKIRQQLHDAALALKCLPGLRGQGDYLRSGEVITNLEFDTTLALARLGLAQQDPELLLKAHAGALHIADHDLDLRTGLAFTHSQDHRSGRPDPGHTWLSGMLLMACLTADPQLPDVVRMVAEGLARHPRSIRTQSAEGAQSMQQERARDWAWPLLELECWLRFVEDPEAEVAADNLAEDLWRRWDPKLACFRFGEGEISQTGRVYKERAWITGGILLPALRASLRRRPDKGRKAMLVDCQDRLARSIRQGKPGLPISAWLQPGGQGRHFRVGNTAEGFLLLDGLANKDLQQLLPRSQVKSALRHVPDLQHADLPTQFSMAARCDWVLR